MTDLEKIQTQHRKELKSLKNKMSPINLIWFESLTIKKQYDFLIDWKSYKYTFGDVKRPFYKKIMGKKMKIYPPKLKHFINKSKNMYRYQPKINKRREVIINSIIK